MSTVLLAAEQVAMPVVQVTMLATVGRQLFPPAPALLVVGESAVLPIKQVVMGERVQMAPMAAKVPMLR